MKKDIHRKHHKLWFNLLIKLVLIHRRLYKSIDIIKIKEEVFKKLFNLPYLESSNYCWLCIEYNKKCKNEVEERCPLYDNSQYNNCKMFSDFKSEISKGHKFKALFIAFKILKIK